MSKKRWRSFVRVGTSSVSYFLHKNSLENKAFKSFWVPSSPLPVTLFCFKILFCVWNITIFFAICKIYLWFIHMANNLILTISLGFKLNSNPFSCTSVQHTLYKSCTSFTGKGCFPIVLRPLKGSHRYRKGAATVNWTAYNVVPSFVWVKSSLKKENNPTTQKLNW